MTTPETRAGLPDGPRAPVVPGARARGPRLLGRRRHLRGLASTPARPARTAPTSTSSTTARRSPTACRTTATCSPATSRTSCRATRPCAAAASSAASAGTATACPPRSRPRSSSGIKHKSEIDGDGRRGVQRRLPRRRCCATPTSGSDYVTRQARWVDFDNDYKTLDLDYMESRHVGLQDAVGQGPDLRGLPGALVLLARARRRCRPPRPRWTTSTATGRTRRSPSACGCASRRPDAGRRRTRWSGRPRRGRCRPTSPSRCTRTSTTCVGRRRRTASATCSPRARVGRVRARARARSRPVLRTVHRHASWSARATRRRSTSSPAAAERAPGARRRLRHHRGRHRARAHRAGVRRGGQGRHRRRRHRGRSCPVDTRRQVRRARCRRTRACTSSTRTRRSSRDLKARRALLLRHETLRAPVPALLALRQPADPAGGVVVVRRGDAVPGPDGRAEPARSPGCPSTSGRPVRQVAGGRARLVDLPQPVLGLADPGVDVATTRRTRASDVYGSLDELERDFGVRPDRPAPARASTT